MSNMDIVVYKRLTERGDQWVTFCREWEVILDSMLIPDKDSLMITKSQGGIKIFSGVIHSYANVSEAIMGEKIHYFKSIIPKGTRFWISDDLEEIASEKLLLTSEKAKPGDKTDLSFLYQHCLDLLTKSGKRVKWSPDLNLEDIRGIYAYDSQAIDLLEIQNIVVSVSTPSRLPDRIRTQGKAKKDFGGRERTRYLREHYPLIEVFKLIPDDSYLPACGEILRAFENLFLINLTRKVLGLGILWGKYWSSTPYDDSHLWCVHPDWGGWCGVNDSYWRGDGVLPFLELEVDNL